MAIIGMTATPGTERREIDNPGAPDQHAGERRLDSGALSARHRVPVRRLDRPTRSAILRYVAEPIVTATRVSERSRLHGI